MKSSAVSLYLRRVLVIATGLLTSNLSVAQNTDDKKAVLEEVIVTAQKRQENAQEVPIAMRALGATQIERLGITNLEDLKALEPSLDLRPFPTAQQSLTPFIRGIGNGYVDVFQDPSVATHINGVYIGRMNGISFDLADLERIEVLKGPQGSLYGRNATGGAINIITQRPHSELGGLLKIGTGNFDRRSIKANLNIPINDSVFTKFSYVHSSKDGFINNSEGGRDFGDRHNNSYRFDLRWLANDNLTLDYGFDRSLLKYVSTPTQSQAARPGGLGADEATHDRNFREDVAPGVHMPLNEVVVSGHTVTLEWALDAVTIKSITAYREVEDDLFNILVGDGNGFRLDKGAVTLGGKNYPETFELTKQDQLSQELQFSGSVSDSLQYLAGLYYFQEESENGFPLSHQITEPNGGPGGSPLFILTSRDSQAENKSSAVFGQLTWTPEAMNRALDLILGFRYSRDTREAELKTSQETWLPAFSPNAPVQTTNFSAEGDETFSEFTPSFTARYTWSEDLMAYGKIVQGYKSGGFNTRAPSASRFAEGFKPETVTSFELGMKADWLESRLRTNVAVFQYDYQDMQVSVGVDPQQPSILDILNAGEATLTGAELNMQFALTRRLSFNLNYMHLDADMDKVKDGAGNDVTTNFTLPFIPKGNYSAAILYSQTVDSIGELHASVGYQFVDYMEGGSSVSAVKAGAFTDRYNLLDARIGVDNIAGSPLSLSVWGRNLADEEYERVATSEAPHSIRAVLWGEPRSYGVDISYNF